MKKILYFFISVFLFLSLLVVFYWNKYQVWTVDIWDSLYCVKTKCYEIKEKNPRTSYCFSSIFQKVCIVNH